jgi:integrase
MWYIAYREDALDQDGRIVRVRRNVPIGSTKEYSKREAQRIADEDILNKINAQSQQPSSLLTVAQFIERRFKPDVVSKKKLAGRKHYHYILDSHVTPALGDRRLRDVTSDDVQRLMDLKFEKGLSTQTVRHISTAISVVFNHAKVKKAFQGELPTFGVVLPEMKRKEQRAMDFAEAEKLLSVLPVLLYALVLLAITTSMNIAEMLGLRWKRVNLTAEPKTTDGMNLPPFSLLVVENYYRGEFGSTKRKARNRILPLGRKLVEALIQLSGTSQASDGNRLVFSDEKGDPLDERDVLWYQLKPAANKVGLDWISWHVFRYTHATLADQLDIPFTDRQAGMGHGDWRMTMLYTQKDVNRRREGIERLTDRIVTLNDTNESRPSTANP